tara:strand:+ start:756 stop:965 length:210 start_codon:yes stop_codon:yes gene_type:complete
MFLFSDKEQAFLQTLLSLPTPFKSSFLKYVSGYSVPNCIAKSGKNFCKQKTSNELDAFCFYKIFYVLCV